MNRAPVLVVDLGTTKAVCALAQPKPLGPFGMTTSVEPAYDVMGWAMAAYPSSASHRWQDAAVMAEAIQQAISQLSVTRVPTDAIIGVTHPEIRHEGVKGTIELADEPVTIRPAHLKRLSASVLSRALGMDRDMILLEPLGYAGNGFEGVRDPVGLSATRLGGAFNLVTLPSAFKKSVLQALDVAGVEPQRLVWSLHAAAAGLHGRPPSAGMPAQDTTWTLAERVLLVDVGGWATDMALVEQGLLVRSATIPWGGACLTDAIATSCRLPWDQARLTSLEGLQSYKPTVRLLVEEQLRHLRDGLHTFLSGTIAPDRILLIGRGALIDGIVEWVETITGVPTSLGRHPQAKSLGELSQQLATTSVFGLLDAARRQHPTLETRAPSGLVDSVLHRTRRLLVEYF